MKVLDERILKYIDNKFKDDKNFDIEKYLNPSLAELRDAKLLKNIDLAVQKIKTAIGRLP